MIDLNHLREHPDLYRQAARAKGVSVDIQAFLKLDQQYRELLKEVEEMRAKQKAVSKQIPGMKGSEKEEALKEMKKFSETLKVQEAEFSKAEAEWRAMQLLLPNLPHAKVPIGKTDKDNKEVKKWGDPSSPLGVTPPSTLKDHVTLGEALGILDFERGVKVAGTRGYFLKGDGARLQQAVLRFTLDHLVKKGWTLFSPPLLATYDCFVGTGFFPGAGQLNIYTVGGASSFAPAGATEDRGREGDAVIRPDNLYLIGTSEVSVCSYHKDEVLRHAELPKRYAGMSSCFRREVGSYGKDTKGLYRIHHFEKVEQVVLCEADEAKALMMFEEIRTNAEEVLQALKLPYRVVDVCTGDMGQGKVYMQDIETWMPSRNGYGETHSCSYLGDFQARRLNIRYEEESEPAHRSSKSEGGRRFVHTLNNTCIASPRILIPILEMYQNADGSVTIPEVLRPYMGGQERISQVTS